MRVLKSFLRPGWLLLAVFTVAFAAACFWVLAPWQLGKNTETEHRNNLIRSAESTAPVPLDELAPKGKSFDADTEWREVTVSGNYLDDKQVLIRLRTAGERPSVEVVTPFQVAGSDRVLLVNRGWVRPEEGNVVNAEPGPAGQVTITARIRKTEATSPGKEPRVENAVWTAYTIDTSQLGRVTALPSEGFYLQLSPNQPGSLGEIELPQLDSGPYLSYGLQWLAFGLMVPLGAGYFIYSEVKARRATKVAAEADESSPPPPAPRKDRDRIREQLRGTGTVSGNDVLAKQTAEIGGGAAGAETDDDVKAKLAQRYGK
ncbi:SURF1 family protein [Gordonia sp. (in: high G+C Gram-positive bacteria)]|uniref:SURF1 family cytochrome oxidase biogenesis protein n=1 Tax=Gordonia sp. (in: high G+C Gram-positive bacteria) TaxID=84139 RepID=UPI003C77F3E8